LLSEINWRYDSLGEIARRVERPTVHLLVPRDNIHPSVASAPPPSASGASENGGRKVAREEDDELQATGGGDRDAGKLLIPDVSAQQKQFVPNESKHHLLVPFVAGQPLIDWLIPACVFDGAGQPHQC
jgi:hypothetical protein